MLPNLPLLFLLGYKISPQWPFKLFRIPLLKSQQPIIGIWTKCTNIPESFLCCDKNDTTENKYVILGLICLHWTPVFLNINCLSIFISQKGIRSSVSKSFQIKQLLCDSYEYKGMTIKISLNLTILLLICMFWSISGIACEMVKGCG